MAERIAHLVHAAKAELAEGPVWYDDALWWVNINAGTLNRLNVSSVTNESFATNDFLGAAVPVCRGGWLLARGHGILFLDLESKNLKTLATLPAQHPFVRFNDGKCDARGRFFAGTMHRRLEIGGCGFYRFDERGLTLQFGGVTISNGFDWSPDGRRLYYTDTITGRVDVLDYDPDTGASSNRRPFVTIPSESGCPDGLSIDRDGNLWVALWGGGAVECFDGATGKSLERISVPARQVSSCCFGGDALDTLFITTAWEGYTAAERISDPNAGGIFAVQPGVQGRPVVPAQLSATYSNENHRS